MTANILDFKDKFRVDELKVFENSSWTWSIRPTHSTIGSSILSLNRFANSFADLSHRESEDLGRIVNTMEGSLRKEFNFEKINYLMLMMVDAHLHFHVIPRYGSSREFSGVRWHDSGWPALPNLAEDQSEGSTPILIQVRDALRKQV